MKNLPNQFFYSKEEDRLNVISHGIGFILSIIGLIFLLNKGLQDFNLLRFLSFLIYGTLAAIFFSKFSDQVFRFSTNSAVTEILWIPVSKNKLKSVL